MIEIIAILSIFAAPAAVVAYYLHLRTQQKIELQQTIRLSIEKGVPISQALIENMNPKIPPGSELRRGLIFIAIGTAAVFAGFLSHELSLFKYLGLFPLAVGAALLIHQKLETRTT